MEYFLQFHWWYLIILIVLVFIVFGKGKGGVVVKRLTAELEVLDERYKDCKIEADYTIFKKGEPHHIDIEIGRLPYTEGGKYEIWLNDKLLTEPSVKRNRKIEFDHWSDEAEKFPVVEGGSRLEIRCNSNPIMKGTFFIN